jgi:hypothetical protein
VWTNAIDVILGEPTDDSSSSSSSEPTAVPPQQTGLFVGLPVTLIGVIIVIIIIFALCLYYGAYKSKTDKRKPFYTSV